MLKAAQTLLALYAVISFLGMCYFLTRAGRWPETSGEWAGITLGSAFLLAVALTIGAARTLSR